MPEPHAGTPSVTFLCTAYRTETTIEETLDSICAQTRPDWQLVVVDNGPSDTIAALVEPYLDDPRVSLVRQENSRAAGGVNAAARHARGRYVAVLHTDDLVEPAFVERLVPLLDADPGTAALACDARYLAEYGLRRPTFRGPVPAHLKRGDPLTLREMLEGWVPYYTALIRREVWDEIGGFRHDTPTVEDLAFWVDLLAAGYSLRTLDEPLAVYRENEESDSRGARGVEIMEASRERVLTEAVERFGTADDRRALAGMLTDSRHRRAIVQARRLLVDGDLPGAQDAARRALAERRDSRTRLIATALTHWPRAARRVYRAKKALRRRGRSVAARVRVSRPRRPSSPSAKV
ncbi:hypothetical protein GCM10023340_04340 [Nocardioides marinquilinus]|uniref:Glycosyltransferase 2-like domain-containing protein n=1 Tax=Nocardioides marinquilinus TaxID=1210400 RepID=A0ABP9P865_9ACTN